MTLICPVLDSNYLLKFFKLHKMKTNKFIITIIAFLGISIAFSSCVKQNFTKPESVCYDNTITANTTINQLKAMFSGDTTRVDDSVIVTGKVISCDKTGNMYKELVIQDDGAAISIQLDDSYLYTRYPLGQKIYLKAGGLYLAKDYGAIKLGALYTEYGIVKFGRIQGEIVIDNHIIKSCENQQVTPKVVTLSQINDAVLYKLIKIENVQFKRDELGTTYADAINLITVNHYITDENKKSLIVRMSAYAQFARDTIASGNGSIVGVLEKYNADYQLMIRSLDDIDFNGERFIEPIFKDFEDQDILSGGWKVYTVQGVDWILGTISGNYVRCKNYVNSANIPTESWYISPELDLSAYTTPKLSFKNAKDNYPGAPLTVKYSNDYDGVSNPNTATWYGLNPTLSGGNFAFVSSGLLSIPTTTKYVAFIYTGSSTDGRTWEVDDILIDDYAK